MADVKKLIEAAERCTSQADCLKCPITDECECDMWPAHVLTIRDHYEAKIKAERVALIAEVRSTFDRFVRAAYSGTDVVLSFDEWLGRLR